MNVPPNMSNALANFIAHADVLVARKSATDEIFAEATDTDISQRTERVVSDLEFHAGIAGGQARFFELGVAGALAALVLLLGRPGLLPLRGRCRSVAGPAATMPPPRRPTPRPGTTVPARARSRCGCPPTVQEVVRAPEPGEGHPLSPAVPAREVAPAPAATAAPPGSRRGRLQPRRPPRNRSAATPDRARSPGHGARPSAGAARRRRRGHCIASWRSGFVSSSLAGSVHQVLTRLDHLQQSQDRLRNSGGRAAWCRPRSAFDEEVETSFAVLDSIRAPGR